MEKRQLEKLKGLGLSDTVLRVLGNFRCELRDFPLSRVIRDFDIYVRMFVDPQVVEDYANAMKKGEKFPPIVITEDGMLVDGFHRVGAYEILYEERDNVKVPAIVITQPLSEREIIALSIELNLRHGKRFTNSDLKRMREVMNRESGGDFKIFFSEFAQSLVGDEGSSILFEGIGYEEEESFEREEKLAREFDEKFEKTLEEVEEEDKEEVQEIDEMDEEGIYEEGAEERKEEEEEVEASKDEEGKEDVEEKVEEKERERRKSEGKSKGLREVKKTQERGLISPLDREKKRFRNVIEKWVGMSGDVYTGVFNLVKALKEEGGKGGKDDREVVNMLVQLIDSGMVFLLSPLREYLFLMRPDEFRDFVENFEKVAEECERLLKKVVRKCLEVESEDDERKLVRNLFYFRTQSMQSLKETLTEGEEG